MLFKDIDIFVTAARAILMGQDPYRLSGVEVFYPLPFYFLFIPIALLPLNLVHVMWTGLQAVVLVALLKRRTPAVLLSTPVMLTFILGQVDIVMMGLFAVLRRGAGGGLALVFLVLKPQLVLLLAPWMAWRWFRGDRRELYWFGCLTVLVAISSFVVQPNWLSSFFERSGDRVRAGISSSIWGLVSFLPSPLWLTVAGGLTIILVVWAWRQNDFDITATVGLLVSPFIFSYNLTPLILLVSSSLGLAALTLVSWLAFAVSAWRSGDGAEALFALAVLAILYWERRKQPQRTNSDGSVIRAGAYAEGLTHV